MNVMFYIFRILDVWDSHKQFLASVGKRVHISVNSPKQSAFELNGHRAPTTNPQEGNETTNLKDEIVIFCHLSQQLFTSKESYRMTISDNKVRIVCADLPGLHCAIVTLVQLFRLFYHESKFQKENPVNSSTGQVNDQDETNEHMLEVTEIIPVYISDSPDCACRGVLLDLNPYGRVPKKVSIPMLHYTINYN